MQHLWYGVDQKEHSPKLEGSLEGEARMAYWKAQRAFIIANDKEAGKEAGEATSEGAAGEAASEAVAAPSTSADADGDVAMAPAPSAVAAPAP